MKKKPKNETRKRNALKKKESMMKLLHYWCLHTTFDKKGRKWKCVLP